MKRKVLLAVLAVLLIVCLAIVARIGVAAYVTNREDAKRAEAGRILERADSYGEYVVDMDVAGLEERTLSSDLWKMFIVEIEAGDATGREVEDARADLFDMVGDAFGVGNELTRALRAIDITALAAIVVVLLVLVVGVVKRRARRPVPTALPAAPPPRKRPQDQEAREVATGMKLCPYCAELIKSEAIVCRYCRRDLPPASERQDTR